MLPHRLGGWPVRSGRGGSELRRDRGRADHGDDLVVGARREGRPERREVDGCQSSRAAGEPGLVGHPDRLGGERLEQLLGGLQVEGLPARSGQLQAGELDRVDPVGGPDLSAH